ncbi:tetratricopeptide repeat protein [Streptomyces sp. URMC 129]|uniref:tetratricopeptide repeat protein n=1 Tax=Streptomyces sp. URMC 129 TaxID=3423407 RepID=UPI003F1E1698
MGKREPNVRLARLLSESGMGEAQFARTINRVAAEAGFTTTYDQPSVSNWLGGTMPRSTVRPFILEALARKLDRPLTYADIGFPAPITRPNARPGINLVEELMELGRSDMDPTRRGVLSAGAFSAALTIPGWPDVMDRLTAITTGRASRIGTADVQAVNAVSDQLVRMYADFGGGYARPLAASFLVNHVGPYLRADGPDEVRKAMGTASAFLCYLTGWMAVDEGHHGLAQQYYVKALEIAGGAEDHATYCQVLRGMSVQATDLGHGRLGVRLADAAAAAIPTAVPRKRAFFAGQQAHAYAVAGDRNAALRAIRDTEVAIDQAASQTVPVWGFSPATLAYTTAQVRYSLGDVAGSVSSLKLHFRLRDQTDTRVSAVRFGCFLAERQLELGHLEAACATWGRVLDEYPLVRSGRADERVAAMKSRLRPYLTNQTARALYERAQAETNGRHTTSV